ncbi:MAG: hypothetical protein ACLVK4_12765 [Alistipes shahii]|uniref:hypothetical protein n=1 Tax=Alistipes shahii TaxID=328814 RepID=UPI00399D20C9
MEDISETAERTDDRAETGRRRRRNYRFSADALAAFKAPRHALYAQLAGGLRLGDGPACRNTNLVDFNAAVGKRCDLPWKATFGEAILAWERPFGGGDGRSDRGACVISDKILNLIDEATDNRRAYLNAVNAYDETWTPTLVGYWCATGRRATACRSASPRCTSSPPKPARTCPAELEQGQGIPARPARPSG